MKKPRRIFPPGSEWLYIKLYAGESSCDKLIVSLVLPFVEHCRRKGWITEWFFIRYADTSFHLRLRLHLSDPCHLGDAMLALNKRIEPLMKNRLLRNCAIDTYRREIERYGEKYIALSEAVFHIDSCCIANIIKAADGDQTKRALSAFILIDQFLSDLGFSLDEKSELIKTRDDYYMREFGFNRHNLGQLNKRYREIKPSLSDVLENPDKTGFEDIRRIVLKRSKELKKVGIVKYRNDIDAPSIMHMMMNRLFGSQNRLNEMVVYNYLNRFYKSQIARQAQY